MATLKVVTLSAPQAHLFFIYVRNAQKHDIEGIQRLADIRSQIDARIYAYRKTLGELAESVRSDLARLPTDIPPQQFQMLRQTIAMREDAAIKHINDQNEAPLRFVFDRADYDFLISGWRQIKDFPTDDENIDRIMAIHEAVTHPEDTEVEPEKVTPINGRAKEKGKAKG